MKKLLRITTPAMLQFYGVYAQKDNQKTIEGNEDNYEECARCHIFMLVGRRHISIKNITG